MIKMKVCKYHIGDILRAITQFCQGSSERIQSIQVIIAKEFLILLISYPVIKKYLPFTIHNK